MSLSKQTELNNYSADDTFRFRKSRRRLSRQRNYLAFWHLKRSAHSLVEMVVAMTVTSVLVLGLTSSLIISVKMLPNGDSASTRSLVTAQILDGISTELENAVHITERTSTSFGFTVPDRNGDGIAERIRYSWSAMPNGSLTRQYNGGTPIILADSLQQFTLIPNLRSVSESYPSLGNEESTEVELINYNSNINPSDNNITASNWVGQFFKGAFPAEVTAWKPTRVRLLARRSSVPAITLVQMRTADANLIPTTNILEQEMLFDSMLGLNYGWVEINFDTLEPIAPDGSICLVLRQLFGFRSCTIQNNEQYAGEVRTIDGGSSWSYDTNDALTCMLYGKRTLWDGSFQRLNANYLMSVGLTMQMMAGSPTLRMTSSMLNHPELLSGLWELKFDQDPTKVDINGDATSDWTIPGNTKFQTSWINGGIWKTNGIQLHSQPGSDFSKTTIIDLRMRNTSVGGNGATFTINALRSGSTCAPVLAYLKLQRDGTQTLTVYRKKSNTATEALINIAGLPNQAVDLQFIIHPTLPAVSISVNGVQRGTFSITRFSATDANRSATIGASGSNAEFSYARIRVME